MKFEELAEKHYHEIDNLSILLKNYVDSYRLLIAGAGDLYSIDLAKKNEVKKALDRVEQVGELIDEIINTLDKCDQAYLKYCKIKNDYILISTEKDRIFTEIDNELNFQNSEREE